VLPLLEDLKTLRGAVDEITGSSTRLFTYFREAKHDEAGRQLVVMDRHVQDLNTAFFAFSRHVGEAQNALFGQQEKAAQQLQKFQLGIAVFGMLTVLAIAWYGQRMSRAIAVSVAERDQHMRELRSASAVLEERVSLRTAELYHTNESLSHEVQERHNAELAVRRIAQQLRQIIDLVPHFIFAKDDAGRFILANKAMAKAYGTAVPVLLGKTDADFVRSPDEIDRFRADDLEVIQRGRAKLIPEEIVTDAKGDTHILQTIKIPFALYGTSTPAVLGVSTDITELKQAEQQIRQLNTDLEERVRLRTAELAAANRELEAFAYSVSHDLRAPLRGIDGWSLALLEDYADTLDAQAQDYLQRVRAEVQRMSRLIDDLLKLSRLSRSGLRLESIDLSAMVESIASRVRQTDPERNAEFVIHPGLHANGDPSLLEAALQNLVENAWKFSGKNPQPRIEVGSEYQNERIAYFVRDNGAGFDMAHAKKLFVPFQRLHNDSDFPGTGIGLATVQRIIRRHGGDIWAEGALGAGAVFFFTLGA
jgi:hypothetical protein